MMINSNKPTSGHLTPHTEQQQATDEPIPTFMSAQLAYAKSKHSKQAEQKKKHIKRDGLKRRVSNENKSK